MTRWGPLAMLSVSVLLSSCGTRTPHQEPTVASDTVQSGPVIARIQIASPDWPLGLGTIALSPDGARAYLIAGSLLVVDIQSRRLLGETHATGSMSLAVSPGGTTVYAADFLGGSVTVLDRDGSVLKTLHIGPTSSPIPTTKPVFALPSRGQSVFLAESNYNKLFQIDSTTRSIVRSVALPIHPKALAVTPDGDRIFVGGCPEDECTTGSVVVMERDMSFVFLADLKHPPEDMAFNPVSGLLYVATAHGLDVIDTQTGTVVGSMPGSFRHLALATSGTFLGVRGTPQGLTGSWISLLDTKTLAVLGKVQVGKGLGIALSPDDRLAYVPSGGAVAIIDLQQLQTTSTASRPL